MKTRVLFVALAIVSAGVSYAQNKVNGTVIDRTDNSKLIGVNATLSNDSGQVAGTTTDINGKFALNAEKGQQSRYFPPVWLAKCTRFVK